uniref:Uncharacterized protein n=1 Tax=Globodera rostochiensis TaxID=31243 RepID=A0A914HJP4_GLORO
MLALLFIAFINYINNYYSVCASSPPPYQWNLINSGNNVQIFAQLIDDIYQQSQPIAKLSFNLTFVKYASELANFRVIEHFNEEMCPTFKVNQDQCVGFQRYSNKLDNFIANEFNKNIFCPEKPIPKMVVDQIMQLIFSFAARILLCLTYIDYYSYDGIGEWQMQTLLSAYKMLAARNDNNEDGIFPFPIEQIGGKGDHMWAKFMNQNISEQTSERKQFIENFNFVLKLSEFSLSYYEVYKVLEAIVNESNAAPRSTINNNNHLPTNDEPTQPAVHTFLKQYFIAKLGSKSMEQYNVNKVDCAFVRFGRELERRLVDHRTHIRYPGFSEYVQRMEAECAKAPWSTKTKNTLYWGKRCH